MMHVQHLIYFVADLCIFIVVIVDEAEYVCFPRRIHLLIGTLLLNLDLVDISGRLIIVSVVV